MKITKVEAFQLEMGAAGKGPRSAFVRIEVEDGRFGLGEASPMQGGLASLVIVANDMAPFLIGKDALDHAVLLDTLSGSFRTPAPIRRSVPEPCKVRRRMIQMFRRIKGWRRCKVTI